MINLSATSQPDGIQFASRQTRLEGAIVDVLMSGGTRSQLRELVTTLAAFLRVRGVSVDNAVQVVKGLGVRAAPFMGSRDQLAVGDAPEDRIKMMAQWCVFTYRRAD